MTITRNPFPSAPARGHPGRWPDRGVAQRPPRPKKTLAFVVNGASDFWKIAEAGVKKAQGELPKYNLQFKYPEQAAAAVQQRVMEDLVAAGVAGIMVSSVDPKNQTDGLNKVAGQTLLFTTDSDAPKSKRVAYIGSSNVELGKDAGKLMLKALPQGGKCIGFVGLPGADNARERIEGVQGDDQGIEGAADRRARRRDRPGPRQAQRRGRAGREPRHRLPRRLLLVQHAAHLRGAEGDRQARQDQGHRLRRGSDHAGRREGRHHRRHGRAAAVRVGLPAA